MQNIYAPKGIEEDLSFDEEESIRIAQGEAQQACIDQEKYNEREKKRLERALANLEQSILRKKQQLAFVPPASINSRSDLTSKNRMKSELIKLDQMESFLVTGFNRGMLVFGKRWFTAVSIMASMFLAFTYGQKVFGSDAVYGSVGLTSGAYAFGAFVSELVAFMLLTAVFTSLKSFLGVERYVSLLNKVMLLGALVGTLGFALTLFQRFVEVSS